MRFLCTVLATSQPPDPAARKVRPSINAPGFTLEGHHVMRSILLSTVAAFAAVVAIAASPASAQTTGGIALTKGGFNTNKASGRDSVATQSVATLGGVARGHGVANTFGGGNTNKAIGRDSLADQQVTTLGGSASRFGVNNVSGGFNTNKAIGRGSVATQQVFTAAQ
jgi:hypothetical protein